MLTTGSSVKNPCLRGRSLSRIRNRSSCIFLAVLAALIFQILYAGWNWRTSLHSGKGLAKMSPTSRVIEKESTMAILVSVFHEGPIQQLPRRVQPYLLPLIFSVVSAMPAAFVGLFVFILTSRRLLALPIEAESRCRKCRHILRGLSAPICPECGEAV